MNKIILYKDFLIEKSIGSENIRNKYYNNLTKSEFYNIINIDPTSVRKKDFSKPGKYSKWMLKEYIKGDYNEYFKDDDFTKSLNYKLFIFSTGWFKSKVNKTSFYIGGTINKTIENDINKFNLIEFYNYIDKYIEEYKEITEDSKYDVIYSNKLYDIVVPLNFTASYETAKNTDWCSKTYSGFSQWNKISILFRILPKDDKYDKLKITWSKKYEIVYFACSKYPEIQVKSNKPFDEFNNVYNEYVKINDKYSERYSKIKETFDLLDDKSKELMMLYRNKIISKND